MHHWLMGPGPLSRLAAVAPGVAQRYFDTPESFTSGKPPEGYSTTRIASFTSYSTFTGSSPSAAWVLYDPERWDDSGDTPWIEQAHPTAFMDAFSTLAHSREHKVILTPARNLTTVTGGDCMKMPGETLSDAYLRSRIPEAGACGDVFEVQAQALQPDPRLYAELVKRSRSQLPAGHPIWAGLTTMRGDSISDMVECWSAVEMIVDGFWLNSSEETSVRAAEFLRTIHP
jgi:hypothetical protein